MSDVRIVTEDDWLNADVGTYDVEYVEGMEDALEAVENYLLRHFHNAPTPEMAVILQTVRGARR